MKIKNKICSGSFVRHHGGFRGGGHIKAKTTGGEMAKIMAKIKCDYQYLSELMTFFSSSEESITE